MFTSLDPDLHSDIFGILDPDPDLPENLCGSESLVLGHKEVFGPLAFEF